ncbi:MAG: group II intron maturase-specific domain-containing protein [Pirellulales bacterium]
MSSIRKFLQSRLRLQVNEEKSKVARPDEIHFLGFTLRKAKERTKVEVHVSDRTKERMDAKIRELVPRMWGQSPSRCIERLNIYLRGWSGYFRICTEENVYRLLRWDGHIRRRLRAILVRQKKRPRHLCRHLQQRGACPRLATLDSDRPLPVIYRRDVTRPAWGRKPPGLLDSVRRDGTGNPDRERIDRLRQAAAQKSRGDMSTRLTIRLSARL